MPSATAVRETAEPPGERVSIARRESGLNLKELATELGISLRRLERIEAGEIDPGPYVPRIAELTERDPAWFSAGVDDGSKSLTSPVAMAKAVQRRIRPRRRSKDGADEGAGGQVAADPELAEPASQDAPRTLTHGERWGRTLVLGSMAGLVVVRLFTDSIHVLPRALNFIDIPIMIVLAISALVQKRRAPTDGDDRAILFAGLLFLAICLLSSLANAGRVELAPVLVFVYDFLSPLVVYWATKRLWPPGNALRVSKLIVYLIMFEFFVVVALDLHRYSSTGGNPDKITGTFGTNADQLVFFLTLGVAIIGGVWAFEKGRLAARLAPALVFFSVIVIYLAQFRALLITLALVILLVGVLVGKVGVRGALVLPVTIAIIVPTLVAVDRTNSKLKLVSGLTSVSGSLGTYLDARINVARNADHMFNSNARFMLTGTGPATYSSRAWATFAGAASTSDSNVAGKYVKLLTGSTTYSTDVSNKYVLPSIESGAVLAGSHAASTPFASYVSLAAEVGFFGLAVMLFIYVGAFLTSLRRTMIAIRNRLPNDALPTVLLGSTAGFFMLLQMAALDNWLEVTRATFLVWMLFAIGTKELKARSERDGDAVPAGADGGAHPPVTGAHANGHRNRDQVGLVNGHRDRAPIQLGNGHRADQLVTRDHPQTTQPTRPGNGAQDLAALTAASAVASPPTAYPPVAEPPDALDELAAADAGSELAPPGPDVKIGPLIVIGQVPPPYHGVAVSTQMVLANQYLRERFDVVHLDTSDRRSLQTIGRWDFKNVSLGLRAAGQLRSLLRGPKGLVYLPISQSVQAFLRDSLYIRIASRRGWHVAVHLRGSDFSTMYEQAPRWARFWIRRTLKRVDSIAVMGESLRGVFAGIAPEERIDVVWNGTPEVPPKAGVRRDPKLGLFLSNFWRRKGVVEAVDAAKIVVSTDPEARFIFAGEWEDAELEELIGERIRDLDGRIEFRSVVTGEALRDLFRQAGFLLFPPVEPEGHPRVVIEGLAAGLPVVTTDRGTIAETIVDGESGFVLDQPDPNRLAERMLTLIRDQSRWERMSRAARERHQARYTVDRADRMLADWLTRVAARRPTGS